MEKEIKKTESIEEILQSKAMQRQIALALPKHLTPERFLRIAITAITKNPKLMQCTKESLINCLLDLSQLGLEPDGRKAHLIPYGNVCTLLVDYKGLVELARRSNEISDVHADVVCENDIFSYSFGSEGTLIHKPALKDRGKPIAAYSFVKMKDGTSSYEVMNVEEIEKIHKRSKAKDSGPWVTDWNEMAKKTVFRRHSKWLPVSSELFQMVNEKDYDAPIDIYESTKPVVEIPQQIKPEEKKEETLKVEEAQVEEAQVEEAQVEQSVEKIIVDNVSDFNTQPDKSNFDIVGVILEWDGTKQTKTKKQMTIYKVALKDGDVVIYKLGSPCKDIVVDDYVKITCQSYRILDDTPFYWADKIEKIEEA